MAEGIGSIGGCAGALVSADKGMPPEAPGTMPVQTFARFDRTQRRQPAGNRALRSRTARRLLVLGGAALVSGLAGNQMRLVLDVDGLTPLEIVVLVLFVINILWISLPLVAAIVGLARIVLRRQSASERQAPLGTHTAVLMPIHHENAARVGAGLEAMGAELVALGQGHAFDLFVLSDTTDAELALAEQEMVWALRRRLRDGIHVYYRRRLHNTARKPGNIREFCLRWGAAYDHLLPLDADSLMAGQTMIDLVRRMENDPDAGLIQTVPQLHDGKSLLARVQQLAATLYGPVLSAGLAWWTGNEGTFWGHNAVLRTQAFMQSAGLPELSGKPPLGGAILSHDFVEAALIRRAGWKVVIADDLPGSFEECPSSLVEMAVRDRRWCQGNLQHVRVLTGKGLHWVSRLHLLIGIFSYLSSPVWLIFLLAAFGLGVQYEFARHAYFVRGHTLFPLWPHLDPARALRLFVMTMAIVLGPKLLGLLAFVCRWRRLRGSGWMLPLSFLFEVVASALVAPVLMLIHCGVVASVLLGHDSGWRPQQREGDSLPWSQAGRYHRWHTLIGATLAAGGLAISWQMLAWLSPAVVGMVLSIPLSRLASSSMAGRWCQRAGLLRTPHEAEPPPVCRRAHEAYPAYREALARTPDLGAIVRDSALLQRHLALTDCPETATTDHAADAVQATAELKILKAESQEDALALLTPPERARVQSLPDLLRRLARLASQGT